MKKKTFGSPSQQKTSWREERLPFIREMYAEYFPSKDESSNISGRSMNICNGKRMILYHWQVGTTVLYVTLGIALILMVAVTLFILHVLVSNNSTSHKLVTKTESKVLELETYCDYQHAEDETLNKLRRTRSESIFNSVEFQHTSAFETERSDTSYADLSTSTEHNVFFVTADDMLLSHQLCAVESAARIMSNYKLYVIILSINNTDISTVSDKRFEQLLNKYPKVKVFRLKGDRYFYDSPIRDILHKSNFSSSLILFAARVLTLWRYGGITYDLDLITLDSTRMYPIPEEGSIMISGNGGAVMSARRKCHPFLYNITTSMTSLYGKRHGSCHLCSKDVLKYALKKFCYNGNKKSRRGTHIRKRYSDNCNGISDLPHCTICNENEDSNTKCIWTSSTARSYRFRKNICPLSYRKYTPEETSNANVIALYENKYILFR
jgi:hypothetical protein